MYAKNAYFDQNKVKFTKVQHKFNKLLYSM